VTTLAKLHRIPPSSVSLESFGKASDFYSRQVKTFRAVSEAQAKTVDVETGKPVGNIPHFDDMCKFFAETRTQPHDRSGFVHGDFKIDNLVFHRDEPRVIGILECVSP
jgi:aminoglycoside phosphotransferase (APT) family kinase protein